MGGVSRSATHHPLAPPLAVFDNALELASFVGRQRRAVARQLGPTSLSEHLTSLIQVNGLDDNPAED